MPTTLNKKQKQLLTTLSKKPEWNSIKQIAEERRDFSYYETPLKHRLFRLEEKGFIEMIKKPARWIVKVLKTTEEQ